MGTLKVNVKTPDNWNDTKKRELANKLGLTIMGISPGEEGTVITLAGNLGKTEDLQRETQSKVKTTLEAEKFTVHSITAS